MIIVAARNPPVAVGGFTYQRDWTGELPAATVTALQAAGYAVRNANSPVDGIPAPTIWPLGATSAVAGVNSTSTMATPPGSPTHDTAGQATGCSN